MAEAWVVECGCKCRIVAFAIDPQAEHGRADNPKPLQSCQVTCLCCGGTYFYRNEFIFRGEPKRNPLCLRKQQAQVMRGKTDGALLIAASLVAAIRMRGAEIRDSPKLNSTIYDAIALARMVLCRLEKQPL